MIIGCLIIGFLMLGGLGAYSINETRRTNQRLDEYSDGFRDFFVAQVDGKGSAFNQAVNSIGDIIAEKQALVTQAAIRGSMGGMQKTINQGLEEVATNENPNLAAMELLPKSLRKNPIAMMGLQTLMQKTMGGQQGSKLAPPASNGDKPKFKL